MDIDNWKTSAHGRSLALAVCIASCLHAFTPAHSAETGRTGSAGKPQPVKFQHAHGEKSVRVRTASYNIRCQKKENDNADYWDNRKSDLVKLVKSIAPDVIGFQEVRDNQYNYLRKQFPDYTFVGATDRFSRSIPRNRCKTILCAFWGNTNDGAHRGGWNA